MDRVKKARQNFVKKFDKDTMYILKCLANDKPTKKYNKMKVAAVKAHLTMGTYAPYVKRGKTKIYGTCKL